MATELLQQHVSNGDGLFQGVSDLLLAYALGVNRVRRSFWKRGTMPRSLAAGQTNKTCDYLRSF